MINQANAEIIFEGLTILSGIGALITYFFIYRPAQKHRKH